MAGAGHITPTADQLQRLAGSTADGPIVMVNLLRFKERADGEDVSGGEMYARYGAAVQPLLHGVGGRILSTVAGVQTVIGPDDERWDLVALVEYPSREAFLQMIGTPEYQRAHELRDSGVADSRLIMSTQLPGVGA